MIFPLEAGVIEKNAHFSERIAFAFSDVHQEGGVLGDMEGAGFLRVDEGVVDDGETVAGESRGGFCEQLADGGLVPIVEDI